MTFIKCANCEKIISIKDLKIPFSPELLNGATEDNTIRGTDLCAECAAVLEAERKAAEEAAQRVSQFEEETEEQERESVSVESSADTEGHE
ncbi:hypothetical protein [Candidatus Avelusimicrobium fimicolum]|jgi:hypothetical protein|uniref:hypothetical protein n=1 Tax=Candidatus Avelusimicrobium fimicolum TaxID=3416216 RepID=UPI003D0D4CDF